MNELRSGQVAAAAGVNLQTLRYPVVCYPGLDGAQVGIGCTHPRRSPCCA
jgi:hypothetical protein